VAFASDTTWQARVRLRVDKEWQWSIGLPTDDAPQSAASMLLPSTTAFVRATGHSARGAPGNVDARDTSKPLPVNIASVGMAKQRTLLVTRERGRWGSVSLRVAAPLTLENLTPFAVEFAHDHGLRGGVLRAGGARCVYEPRLLTAPLALRLLPFARWSSPLKLKRGAPTGGTALVQRGGVVPAGERADLTLLLGAAGKPGAARTLYIGVPYVLANRSDLQLEMRQRSHTDGARLPIGANRAFSWNVTGPRQVCDV
jgi:hypothetical protein